MSTSQDIEEGRRLRSRIVASPFGKNLTEFPGNAEDIAVEDLRHLQINNRAMISSEIPANADQQLPILREEINENTNAFSINKTHENLTFQESPTTRPKQLGTDFITSNQSEDLIKGLNNQDKLALVERLIEESPEFVNTLANKFGNSKHPSDPNISSIQRTNSFVCDMPYPPDMDRRNIHKQANLEAMSSYQQDPKTFHC